MTRKNQIDRRKSFGDFPDQPNKQHPPATASGEERIVASKREVVTFQGPLPHPDILARYEEIQPGAAERVLKQFERETEHRHSMEQAIVSAQIEAFRASIPIARLGQVFGLIIAVVGITAGAVAVIVSPTAGHAAAGASIAGASLATLVGVFVYGRKTKPEGHPIQEKKIEEAPQEQQGG